MPRPLGDTPKRTTPLYVIEVPDKNGKMVMHHGTYDINAHQAYLEKLHAKGFTEAIERRIKP